MKETPAQFIHQQQQAQKQGARRLFIRRLPGLMREASDLGLYATARALQTAVNVSGYEVAEKYPGG